VLPLAAPDYPSVFSARRNLGRFAPANLFFCAASKGESLWLPNDGSPVVFFDR
jgi:hypothetical protein